MQHSSTSAFIKPRQEHQRLKTAEKVSTDRVNGSRQTIKSNDFVELKESKLIEPNNNNGDSKLAMMASNFNARQTVDSTGIPRRNFMKQSDHENLKSPKDLQRKENSDKNSPRPRRKLPSAPGTSGPRPRTPKSIHEVQARTTAAQEVTEKTRISEKPKAKSVTTTPEKTKKVKDSIIRKYSDPSDKKYRIVDESANSNRKTSDPVEIAKSTPKGFLGNIKYNSLPRRRPSKTRSKFYLDIEGEDTIPSKSTSDLSGKNGVSDKLDDDAFNNIKPTDNEKGSTVLKNNKIFGTISVKQDDSAISFTNGVDKPDLKQTHVALYRFIPRHKDEVTLDEGDPINVITFGDDLWCEGTNLSSGKYGIFPSRYAADILSGSGSG